MQLTTVMCFFINPSKARGKKPGDPFLHH